MTLFLTALAIGFVHTLVGPDHYIPFIVIGRARRWSLGFTSLLTFVCGLGHVISSVVLGLLGMAFGSALSSVMGWEGARGNWAGWALLLVGTAYAVWGVWRTRTGKGHRHVLGSAHVHPDAGGEAEPEVHAHTHYHAPHKAHDPDGSHEHDHGHDHGQLPEREADDDTPAAQGAPGAVAWKALTPWLLIVIFVLGPCEPLIPLFFASGLQGQWGQVLLVALGYGIATLVGMHLMVTLCWFGLRRLDLGPLERWSHALAGAVIALAGLGMVFLGL